MQNNDWEDFGDKPKAKKRRRKPEKQTKKSLAVWTPVVSSDVLETPVAETYNDHPVLDFEHEDFVEDSLDALDYSYTQSTSIPMTPNSLPESIPFCASPSSSSNAACELSRPEFTPLDSPRERDLDEQSSGSGESIERKPKTGEDVETEFQYRTVSSTSSYSLPRQLSDVSSEPVVSLPACISITPPRISIGDKSISSSAKRYDGNSPFLTPRMDGASSSRSSRSPRLSPAAQRWKEAGRRVSMATKVMDALKLQESRYFSAGRIVAKIVADNILYWPLRDVRSHLSRKPFSSYLKMISWKQTLFLLPMHFTEDLTENFLDERDELENRQTNPRDKAKFEILSSLISFSINGMRMRFLCGAPLIPSPLSLFHGAAARLISVAPFLGGYDALVPFVWQTSWLVGCYKPLSVIATVCATKDINEYRAIRLIYDTQGLPGFFRGAWPDLLACATSLIAPLLVDFNVPTIYLTAGLAASCALWANPRGPDIIRDIGYLSTTGFATAFLKKAVAAGFGDPPIRQNVAEVDNTRQLIENKKAASCITSRLSRRAETEQFYADVNLETSSKNSQETKRTSENDEESLAKSLSSTTSEMTVPKSVSVNSFAHTVSSFMRQATKFSLNDSHKAAAAYVSGLHGNLYILNGRYDVEFDAEGNIALENGRAKYRRMIHLEVTPEDEEIPTEDFAYIRYMKTGELERWTLVDEDKTTVLGFCNDSAQVPYQIQNTWQILKADSDTFADEVEVKVSREPTPFLHRMNVFSLLNQMLDMEDNVSALDELDRAVEPSERFCMRIRRQSLAKSSLQAVLGGLPSDLVAHEFAVEFKGECGLDYGGLTREWFSQLANELATINDIDMQLWNMKIDREGEWWNIMPDESILPVEGAPVEFYFAVGRLLAMALIHGSFFPLPLCHVIFKYILGTPVSADDIRTLDPDFFKHRVERLLRSNGATEIAEMLGEPLTFVSAASPRSLGEKPLCEDGQDMEVTEQNKLDYAHLLVEEYLCGTIRPQLKALVTGFWDLCPRTALQAMSANDLKVLTVGCDECFDVEIFRQNAKFEASEEYPEQFEWFMQSVAELSAEESVRFLQFFTGASRMPREGLRPPFTLVINNAWNMAQLPTAHTCANTVCIPAYESKELLDTKLRMALEFNVGFGFE